MKETPMPVPNDRRYARTHEWCKLEGARAVVGITQFAADQLTDITFVELPAVGTKVEAGRPCGQIESVKSAGDLYAPISGEVAAANQALNDEPGLINKDPFGAGWIIQIRPSDTAEMNDLVEAPAYEEMTAAV
jgi:glycine cleavage system H protein